MRDGFRVAVDHDGLEPGLAQRIGRVHAAIVELDPLADAVRAAAEDDRSCRGRSDRPRRPACRSRPHRSNTCRAWRRRTRRRRCRCACRPGCTPSLARAAPRPSLPSCRSSCASRASEKPSAFSRAQRLRARAAGRAPRPRASAATIVSSSRRNHGSNRQAAWISSTLTARRAAPAPPSAAGRAAACESAARNASGAAVARRLDRVEAGKPGLHAAQALLQRLGESCGRSPSPRPPISSGGQQRRRAGEFLEGEARDLDHHIVDRRLEARRRDAGDVVGEFVERVADRELRRDLGDRKAGRLGGQRRGARDARVHLDHHHAPIRGVDRELHVGAAGIDADLAQARDRGVAHPLVFLVGQRQRRGDGDGIAGVHAHRIDVLDGADDDAVVRAVADHLHLEFLPAEHAFLDQHLVGRRGVEAAGDDLLEFLAVVGDAAAGAAEREARPDDRRQADLGERLARLVQRCARWRFSGSRCRSRPSRRGISAGPRRGRSPRPARRSARRRSRSSTPCGRELHRGVQRGLAAHGRQQRVRLLARDDLLDDLRRDRLDIGGIRQIRIGHDRRRVGVDQDRPGSPRPAAPCRPARRNSRTRRPGR